MRPEGIVNIIYAKGQWIDQISNTTPEFRAGNFRWQKIGQENARCKLKIEPVKIFCLLTQCDFTLFNMIN